MFGLKAERLSGASDVLEEIRLPCNPADSLASPFLGPACILADQPDVADDHKAMGGFDVVSRSKHVVLTLT